MAVREAMRLTGPRALAEPEPEREATAHTGNVLLLAVVFAAAYAAAVHAFVVPEHMMELAAGLAPGWLPLAFAVSAGVGFLYVLGIGAFGFSRQWLAVGLGLHALMAAAGILSRTWGLPGVGVEGPTRAWITATAAELIVAVLCAILLTTPARPGPWTVPGLVVVGVAILLAAGIGLLLVGPSDVVEHSRMLARWMWRPVRPARWMWLPVHPRLADVSGLKWW